MSPLCQALSRLANISVWSFVFDVGEGFCKSKAGAVIAALIDIDSSADPAA